MTEQTVTNFLFLFSPVLVFIGTGDLDALPPLCHWGDFRHPNSAWVAW